MIRRPPRSTLFPTRRSSDLRSRPPRCRPRRAPAPGGDGRVRSEEHTSELQSLAYLVCRLLLEKKNYAHIPPDLTVGQQHTHQCVIDHVTSTNQPRDRTIYRL